MEKLLRRKLVGGEKGRLIAAKLKHDRRIEEIKKYLNEGIKEVGKLSERDRFMVGVSLYAGEGGKRSLQFANSDPRIIKFMMEWFRNFCQIPEDKFRGAIWIHDNLDVAKAKSFWSVLTGIPKKQFFKTYLAKNKVGSRKIRKNLHSYGVFSIAIMDTRMHRKVMGWLAGVLGAQLL